MTKDPIDALRGTSFCPVCGCIELSGSIRCSECGTFHSSAHLEEREAPPPSSLEPIPLVDPSSYSLAPNSAELPDETFEESDSVTKWQGGSTDFSVDADIDDEKPLSRIDPDDLVLPDPEELTNLDQ